MNTGKQINAMVVVLFLTLITVGIYAVWDPFRAESAEEIQLEEAAERAAITFTQNCRLCHGDAGQGGAGDSGRLAGAAQLDTPGLRGIEGGAFDLATFNDQFTKVYDTISCGRVGTQMPTWGDDHGGTLNEEQIRQLAVLITGGDSKLKQFEEAGFWEIVQEHADEIDAETTHGATLNMPDGSLSADATEIFVSNAGQFALGQYIRIKNPEEGEERMRILPDALRVTRGAQNTQAADHDVGAAVLDVNGNPILDRKGETEQALIEAMDDESALVVVADTRVFEAGDVIQIDNERLEVEERVRGLPTTTQRIAREIGREPKRILVSGAEGLSAGMTVRVGAELMEITEVRNDGDPGISIIEAVDASSDTIAVSRPSFFAEDYVLQVGDELMRVIGPVDTGQTLGQTIGRAQTSFPISGADGIEPGMLIRVGDELMRVTEVLEPARIQFERAQPLAEGEDPSTAASHTAGSEFLAVNQPAAEEGEEAPEPTFDSTDVLFDEAIDANVTEVRVNTVGTVSVGSLYRIDDEIVKVTDVLPAQVRVERGSDGAEVVPHGRREAIYNDSLIEVSRGFAGTTAAAHDPGDAILMTEISVRRERDGSVLQDHSKNAEIYLGNSLIVLRGQKQTEPAEHENGETVYDFPPAPDGPPILQQACGQTAAAGGATTQATPVPGSTGVDVSLTEFVVEASPSSVAAGLLSFIVANEGSAPHNLHVIQTDLPEDQLPIAAGDTVDLSQLTQAGSTETIAAGGFAPAPVIANLAAGRYVLICNVPTHYSSGMHTVFTVQ